MPPVSIYIECGPVGNSDYTVGILQIMDPANAKSEGKARQAIVDTFNNVDESSSNADDDDEPKPTKTPKSDDDDDNGSSNGNGGEKVSTNVVTTDSGALYTSPSYGFQVGILPGYTVEEDSVQNGYDTLVVANDTSRVTYSMFLSNSTPNQCISSIINNLTNDGSIGNFQIGTDGDGNELRGEGDGYSYVVVLFTSNGSDWARYYACVGGSGAILVFAYEAPLDKFVDQADEIEQMINQIVIPE